MEAPDVAPDDSDHVLAGRTVADVKPIADMTDAELSEAYATEVLGWSIISAYATDTSLAMGELERWVKAVPTRAAQITMGHDHVSVDLIDGEVARSIGYAYADVDKPARAIIAALLAAHREDPHDECDGCHGSGDIGYPGSDARTTCPTCHGTGRP